MALNPVLNDILPGMVALLSVPSADLSGVYHPCVDMDTGEVLCDCGRWRMGIEPILNSLGMMATVKDRDLQCSHIRGAIRELIEEGLL
jgi:hypothetical protein